MSKTPSKDQNPPPQGDGDIIAYHLNGKMASKISHVNGKKHGKDSEWNEDGTNLYEVIWKAGKRHGPETFWGESGLKRSEIMWRDDVMHGIETTWWRNGTKQREIMWVNNKMNGVITYWDEDGTKRREMYHFQHEKYAHIDWDKKRNVAEVNFTKISAISAPAKSKKSPQNPVKK